MLLGCGAFASVCYGANPVLLIGSVNNHFSYYTGEILRAEGLNAFDVADLTTVTASTLEGYDVVILGHVPLAASHVTLLTNYVNAGGHLIALRPDKQLASLMGLTDAGTTLSNGYLSVATAAAPGAGIVGQTIQFHGAADQYLLSGAQAVATLYSTATTATSYPAVTLRTGVGSGGSATAFTYDLARSIVYTRQGNPAWAEQARVGQGGPIRAGDMFYGDATFDPQPDWIDLTKVAIPQADEQQRLLFNLILHVNQARKPLPRFWYLPFGKKAAVVMTGDDHAQGGTAGRFDSFIASSPAGCSVANWECIRGTSYVYTSSPLSSAQATAYNSQGFEIGVHVNTGCANYTPSSLEGFYASQLSAFASTYPGIPAPSTNRTHCIAWSDWSTQAQVSLNHGIRLDTNYYYWPPSWVVPTPGFFTGSGIPMRFARTDGSLIDVYQAATQMTDESGQVYPDVANGLLDNAIGPAGYYGVFTANMHTDCTGPFCNSEVWAGHIVNSAKSRGVPVVTAKQMLDWLDGRNNSSFSSIAWSGNTLSFTLSAAGTANGLQAMLPIRGPSGALSGITRGGAPVAYTVQTIKGVDYAFFDGATGSYLAAYTAPLPPIISLVADAPGSTSATITWTTDKPSTSRVDYGTAPTSLTQNTSDPSLVTNHSINLSGLSVGTTYYYRVTSVDAAGGTATAPPTSSAPANFTTIDPSAPIITAVVAAPDTNGRATITWTTSKASNSRVDYGTSAASLSLNSSTPAMVTAHSITLTGLTVGTTYYYRVTSVDNLGNSTMFPASLDPPLSFVQNVGVSVWPSSVTPTTSDNGTAAVELGMKFRSDAAGIVTGVRFYKVPTNTGTHIGNLWTTSGTLLGTVTFADETPSGWQKANFAVPVPIAANTTYVISYFAPNGNYSFNPGFFSTNGVDTPPLHALADGVSGPNGVYRYGSTSSFPNLTFNSSNYWVDVVFFDNVAPAISAVSVIPTPTTATITWSTNEAANSRVNYGTSPDSLTQSVANATFTTNHSILLTGLTTGTTYYYSVTSEDSFGNSTTSPPATFVPTNPPAPVISAISATPGSTTAVVSWTTDLASTSRVNYGISPGALNLTVSDPALVTSHGIALTGLAPSTTYYYQVTSITSAGGSATAPTSAASFVTTAGTGGGGGNPPSEWDISGAGDSSIQGFPVDISVNKGETIAFKINTNATAYAIDIYRMGYYGGNGASKVATIGPAAALPQSQPACVNSPSTGLIDCGNWAVSASWAVPGTAKSGIYFAKLTRTDTGGASHIFFVVRDDESTSDILFQTSDTTWQAYNQFGGNSLYVGSPAGRAYKVSYNRPITTRSTTPEDFVFNAEYPMVRWLEANGYDVTYTTGVDTDRRGALIRNHKIFLSVGHDEYWSGNQRANVEAARAAGVHLAFFSGNEVFWKTRWEDNYRTLVCYKETHANAVIDPLNPPTWTGTWRDPRFSPPGDGGRPENGLTGTIFTVNGGTSSPAAIQVPAEDGKLRFWRNTGLQSQPPGAIATLTTDTLGYEWDEDLDNGARPAGLIRLSTTPTTASSVLQDYGSTFGPASVTHNATLYRASSGAMVFSAGTVQWSWGLDSNHDRGSAPADVRMQQAVVNLFADMGVQPTTMQPGLVPASSSTDVTAPASTITSPANGSVLQQGSSITITGTATDSGGGLVGGVEVSVDGGTSWHPATGRSAWSYSWTPTTSGTFTIASRATDDSLNTQGVPSSVTVTVPASSGSNSSIWSPAATPGTITDPDPAAVELGLKFRSDIPGLVTGVRFYKGPSNTGTHVGKLWTNTGSLLASVTFTGESASGWQQALFSNPVAINANTTYVVSYYAPNGQYSADTGYFSSAGVDSPPLHALRSGVDGPNGVYRYGTGGGFPTDTYQSTNYWVDIVFTGSPVTLSPGSLSFGNQAVGTSSAAQLVSLTNTSTTAVSISSIAITGTNSAEFTQTNTCGASVAAGASCLINVVFAPSATGTRTATLTVAHSGFGSPHSVSLNGTGVAATASLSPVSVTFGNQAVGVTSSPTVVTLSNTGTAVLTITGITIAGTNSADFAQTNTCGTSVAAGANCTISVTFTPSATGTRTAEVTITDNAAGSPRSAGLTGTGVAPAVGLSPTSVSFANQAVGTTSAASVVTLTNSGTGALTISSIAVSGANSADFAQTSSCGATVAAGANCAINITFTPSATGTRNAEVIITDNAAGSPRTVPLTGNGVASAVTVSPTSIAFGNQLVDTPSAVSVVTLTNTSAEALTISAITITGPNGTEFTQTNTCGPSVAAGANCAINVRFTPSSTGARTATLTIADSAAGSPRTVGLTGTGVAPAVGLSATSVSFTNQLVGTTSAASVVTLTNSGTGDLTISSIALSGANSADFAQTNSCGATVAAGANCTINITFTPSASGARTAEVTITDNATGSPRAVALTGTGVAPAVTLSPAVITFGNQPVGAASAPSAVTLTNSGTAVLTVSSIGISGPNGADFAQTNTCGATVAAGANCTISVTFTPSAAGARAAEITIADNAAGSPHTVSLTGTGVAVGVILSPTSVAFGNQLVGTSSTASVVTLTNTGTEALTITGITIAGPNSAEFAQVNTCGASVAGGANCTISLTFTPSATGIRTAELTITDSGPGSPRTVALTGTGVAPAVGLSPASLAFGNQLVGTTSAAGVITLTNTGTSALSISGITVSGLNGAEFAETNTCGANLAAGANCAINVTFTPSATGLRSAEVTVASNATGSPHVVNLTGTGVAPAVTLSPVSLAFGDRLVGTTSAASIVTLTNTGTGALTITSISITGANSSNFGQTNSCGASVAAGANCTINVTFTPSAIGIRTAEVTIVDNASGSPRTVLLTGNGVAPTVSLSPTSLAFGNQVAGTTSAASSVTLTNTGTAALTISSISITGSNSSNFAQTNNCGTSVAAGANCTISVTFTPSSTGSRSASLNIASNAPGSPHTVSLTGTGVTAQAVSLSPPSTDFGNQTTNTTSAASVVTLTNPGTATLTITSISISGTNSSNFAQTNTCGISVAAGASCAISVTFRPTATGTRTASVRVASNATGSPHFAALTGVGVAPAVSVTPSPISFGNQTVGVSSAPLLVTLTNTGAGVLTVSGVSITGTHRTNFAQTNTCTASVAPGANCTFSITFTPSGSGLRTAGLRITSNAPGSPHTIAMSGTGVVPVVSLSPTSVAFGNQPVGTTSAAQSVTLTNTGLGVLSISSISIVGTHSSNFAQTNNCGTTLAAGANCTFNVTFTPSATGTRTGSLRIADSASGSPHSAGLTGVGQ